MIDRHRAEAYRGSMDAHKNYRRDPEAAKAQAAWQAEWDRQFALLPQAKQDAIKSNPLVGYADELDEATEKALCERGDL